MVLSVTILTKVLVTNVNFKSCASIAG